MAANVDNTVRELVYEFLDDLRESEDAPNMFGATLDLQEEFGFDKAMSRELLSDWMAQYGKDDDDE